MNTNTLSQRHLWTDRNHIEGIEFPGIYLLHYSTEDISGRQYDWDHELEYIGMTNAKKGLRGRLQQFDNTIKGKRGHGGAARFLYVFRDYPTTCQNLYVSVSYLPCNPKSPDADDYLLMGEVAKHEYTCFAKHVKVFGQLPVFNRMTSPKL